MAVEITQNLTQVTISSVGVAGRSGTSGTSGLLLLTGSTDNGLITLNGSAPSASVESNLTFDGNLLTIAGSGSFSGPVVVDKSVTTQILLNPKLIEGDIEVPNGYNGMLVGPISNSGSLSIYTDSTLVII
jgi:cytoskeletal protein CcmA (bactofilin family)